jgi:hypothetical protein
MSREREGRATEPLTDPAGAQGPILIAQHDLPSVHLVDIETNEQHRIAVLERIARGEIAVAEGRVVTHAEARGRMARWLE